MNIEEILVDGYLRRHLSTVAYMIIAVLGGMAILLFAAAMGYEILQLINSVI